MYQFEPHHVYIEKGLPYPLDTHQPEFEDEPNPRGGGRGLLIYIKHNTNRISFVVHLPYSARVSESFRKRITVNF